MKWEDCRSGPSKQSKNRQRWLTSDVETDKNDNDLITWTIQTGIYSTAPTPKLSEALIEVKFDGSAPWRGPLLVRVKPLVIILSILIRKMGSTVKKRRGTSLLVWQKLSRSPPLLALPVLPSVHYFNVHSASTLWQVILILPLSYEPYISLNSPSYLAAGRSSLSGDHYLLHYC